MQEIERIVRLVGLDIQLLVKVRGLKVRLAEQSDEDVSIGEIRFPKTTLTHSAAKAQPSSKVRS
jgi:hypothetical protein